MFSLHKLEGLHDEVVDVLHQQLQHVIKIAANSVSKHTVQV